MQYDGTLYGIIPDTFQTILTNYLTALQSTFPNASDPSSPAYTMAYVNATQDQVLQAALTSLWNAINANTASGLGLNILASTVLNLLRPGLIQSTCQVQVVIGPIYSMCQIQINVTAGTFPVTLATGWQATGGVTTTAPYLSFAPSVLITGPGVYYLNVRSTDTTTPIPAANFTGGTPNDGLTYTVTNPAPAVLGSFTIPTTWKLTASSLGTASPSYSPNAPQTFITAGTYYFLVYSNDVSTPIPKDLLNTQSPVLAITLISVTNPYAAILGSSPLDDADFQSLRRNYLNLQGQTYNGMINAVLALDTPGLQSVFIAETISQLQNLSTLIIKIVVNNASGPVVIPNGWTVTGSASPVPNYATLQEYTFTSSGTFWIPTYSIDAGTAVPVNSITGSTPAVTGLTLGSPANADPAILGGSLVPNGLGQRGYTVYLNYPSIQNSQSFCIVSVNITSMGPTPPYTIPIGWTVSGGAVTPNSPYATTQSYTINTIGIYFLVVTSTDITTQIPVGNFNAWDPVVGLGISAVTNTTTSQVFGYFDTNDPALQEIANTLYQYHPLGTQFYAGLVGGTTFVVDTPYGGYTSNVILNPFQTLEVTVSLKLVYNSNPADSGISNGVFDTTLLPILQTQLITIINDYFESKNLPDDLLYSINELTEVIEKNYTGIVALVGNANSPVFSFGTFNPTINGQLFLRRMLGFNFHLSNANFDFSYLDKG